MKTGGVHRGTRDRTTAGTVRLLLLGAVAGALALLLGPPASADPFAATASVTPSVQYLGDKAGTLFTFTVTNTGTSSTIGAVQITRPGEAWKITACPLTQSPPGWSATRSDTMCRFTSAASTGDDIPANGGTATFQVKATTDGGPNDRAGTWGVIVSQSNRFDNPSLLTLAGAPPGVLDVTAHSFEIVDARLVTNTPTAAGAACPSGTRSALTGATGQTVVICGRNRTNRTLTPVVAQASLGGTFVSSPGAFASGAVPKSAANANVVLGWWTNVTVTGSSGQGKTVIAKVGSAPDQTSPLTTLTGYEATNPPPVADAQSLSTNEGTPLAITLTGSDPEGQPITFNAPSAPSNGLLTGTAPNVTYTPAVNFNGSDSFTFTVNDGTSNSAPATVSLTVAAVNDAPVNAVPGAQTVLEDGALTLSTANWNHVSVTDVDAGAGNVTVTVSVVNGTLTLGSTSSVTPTGNGTGVVSVQGTLASVNTALDGLVYAPAANFTGSDTLTVLTTDNGNSGSGGALIDQDTVAITVTAVNDAPSFTKGGNTTVFEDAGAQTVSGWATGISAGPADESGQAVDFVVSNDNNSLFVAQPAVSPTGDLTYTPAANANGSATVTVHVHDDGGTVNGGDDASDTQTFTITVTAVNDAPTFTTGGDVGVLEDSGAYSGAWATAISSGPSDESGQTLSFHVTSNTNASLFSAGPAVSSSGELTFTPAANANGLADVTVELRDNGGTANAGAATSSPVTFRITVTPVNDAPSFTKGADQTVNEDAGAQTVSGWATGISAGPADESAQAVNFVVSNDNQGMFAAQPAVSAAGHLTYTPAANANGSATVTVHVHDDGGTAGGGDDTSDSQQFTITVTAVNDEPSFQLPASPDQAVLQDSGAQTVTGFATDISAGPSDESTQAVTFHVSNNNTTLFTTTGQPDIDEATGDLTYTPAAGAFGSATVTVYLSDNGGTANGGDDTSDSQTFTITVNPPNVAPTADATSASGNEDGGAIVVTLTGHDADGDALTFDTGTATNGLVTVPGAINCSGTPSTCTTTVTYTPNANFFGSDSFTYKVNDGAVDSASATAAITVNPVNDVPSFTKGADQTVNEDSGAQTVSGWATAISAGPTNESGQTLAFNVTSNTNAALFAAGPAVSSSGELTYTPAADASGSATVTVKLSDNGGTTNGGVDTSAAQTFTITVTAVNDVPSFTKGADQTVNEDAGAQSVSAWATAISKGPADESGQTLTFNVTNNNNGVFSVQPAVSPTGTLTFTSAANKHGSATVTVSLSDNGGTANGGDDTSDAQTFTITVNAVNDPPTAVAKNFTAQANMKISLGDLLVGAADAADTGANPSYTPTFTVGSVNAGAGCIGCTVSNINSATGTFDFDPPAGGSGTYTIEYTVVDSGDPAPGATSAPQTITMTVNGPVIWFVDAAAAAGGTGRLSAPFNTLAGAAAVDAVNHRIFVAPGTYADGITLPSGEWLTGSGAEAASFDALMGITPPAGTIARPAVDTTRPTVSGAVVLGSNNTLRGLTFGGSPALSGSSFGTLTLGSGATTDVALASAGQALSLTTGTISGDFLSTSSSGGTNNVLLSGVSSPGTSLGTGALSAASGEGFKITGGNGTFSYSGTVTNAGGATVSIANKTGGTVTLSGAVSDTAGAGVSLTSNTGATIAFTGGVNLTSGTSPAFAATGGGTVSVTGSANTLASTTGTALTIANTTIGAADVTFRSISSNGAAKGIVLDTTGSTGNLVVTGNGGTCTAADTSGCSGGTIANSAGADDSTTSPVGTGIVLNSTRDVSLTRMFVNGSANYGIRGNSVTNLSIVDSVIGGTNGTNSGSPFNDGSAMFNQLTGTVAFTRVAVSGGFGSNVEITNTTGTLNSTFDAVRIGANSTTDGNDGLQVEGTNTATVNATIQNSFFTSSRGDLVQYIGDGSGGGSLTMTGNTLSNDHPGIATGGGGVSIGGGASGPVTLNIATNTSSDAVGHAWLIVKNLGGGSMTGTFTNNTVGVAAVANSGSLEGDGLKIHHAGTGTLSMAVTNNAIRQYNNQGVHFQAGAGAVAGGTLNITSFSGNTVANPGTNAAIGGVFQGVHLNSGVTPGDSFVSCIDFGTNTINGSGRNGGTDFRLRQRQSTTVRLPGYAGAPDATATVVSFVQNKIGGGPSGSAFADHPTSGGGFVGAACS